MRRLVRWGVAVAIAVGVPVALWAADKATAAACCPACPLC
jgi:hypothetical protein